MKIAPLSQEKWSYYIGSVRLEYGSASQYIYPHRSKNIRKKDLKYHENNAVKLVELIC